MEQPHPTGHSVEPCGLWGELGLLLHHKDILGQQSGHNCITFKTHLLGLAARDRVTPCCSELRSAACPTVSSSLILGLF